MAERDARIAQLERDVALDVAAEENHRRNVAERLALEAQIRAEDSERAARTLSASASAANDAAENANTNTWTTGLIALVVIIGLVIGGSVMYNGYKGKNDKLYTATINSDRAQTENRMLAQENARNAARPASILVHVPDAGSNLQRTEEAARPTPPPTVERVFVPVAVPVPAATPVPQPSVAPDSATAPPTAESATTTTTTTADGDHSTNTPNSGGN